MSSVLQERNDPRLYKKCSTFSITSCIHDPSCNSYTCINLANDILWNSTECSVNIFTIVSLLNTITESTTLLSFGARSFYDGLSSLKRIEDYLLDDFETDEKKTTNGGLWKDFNKSKGNRNLSITPKANNTTDSSLQPFVSLNRISSSWFDESSCCTLHDVSLNLNSNQLLMVTGPIGSGKTTLLMTILRQIPIISGDLLTRGKIAYVSQIPFIFTGTLRDNILFGK